MRYSIKMFPVEIWELIFEKIDDPADILKLQEVCKAWKEMIKNLLARTQKWREICKNKIPAKCLCDVLEKTFPALMYNSMSRLNNFEYGTLSPDVWKTVYRAWKRLQDCMKVNPSIESKLDTSMVKDTQVFVFCTAVWDDIVAFGLNNQQINFYRIDDLGNPFWQCNYGRASQVYQIEFWYTDERLIAVTRSLSNSMKFLDVEKKMALPSAFPFEADRIYRYQNECYSVCQNILTQFELRSDKVQRRWEILVPLGSSKSKIIGMHMDNISVNVSVLDVPSSPVIKTYNFFTTIGRDGKRLPIANKENVFEEISGFIKCDPHGNRKLITYFQLPQDITLGVCGDWIAFFVQHRALILHKDTLTHMSGTVRSAVFHANLFVFGLSSGSIYIFRVNKIKDLLHLDFATLPSKEIKLGDFPINYVDVIYSQGKPMIIAKTWIEIHVIKFHLYSNPIYLNE